jgi:serine/threonine protein kinase/Flp pilus assembly protein TadD
MTDNRSADGQVRTAAAASASPAAGASAANLDDPRILRAMEEYLALLQQGERPDRQAFLARYAEVAELLSECLHGLDFVQAAGPELSHPGVSSRPSAEKRWDADDNVVAPAEPLGDFRIVRELGRGGMGVVYEAVQISLGRRVALKVLPFAAALDARQLQRFKHEAQAAALLHQPNIVPVFGVGNARGVHYYAMQYIEGQDLACLIRRLRRQARKSVAVADQATGKYVPSSEPAEENSPSVETAVAVLAGASTEASWPGVSYVRAAARLGIQAAEALEHAHQLGVIHRDIKPANLLLDLRDNLWITDFGLAQLRGHAGLTVTGDLVGTLRYMSPEQALANRVVIDHRCDIYSLGATLYELLTLEPAFPGDDRQELLRQIAFDDPQPLRRKDKSVPAEVETIVLKALAKNPEDRYASAQELADDLRRFLEHKPIRARRPKLRQRAVCWARRYPALAWSATTAVLAAAVVLAASIGYVARDRAARLNETMQAATSALDEADKWEQQRRWPDALASAERAKAVMGIEGGDKDFRTRVGQRRDDLAMVVRLQEIRLEMAAVKDENFDLGLGDTLYAAAFRDYGIDVEAMEPEEVARRLPNGAIREEMIAALDDWARVIRLQPFPKAGALKRLLLAANAADPGIWRSRVREVLMRNEGSLQESLKELANSAPRECQHPSDSVYILQISAIVKTVELLRDAQRRRPGDFWLNNDLAELLSHMQPPQHVEALSFYRAALALRPDSPGALINLGKQLSDLNRQDEAIAAYERAILLHPSYATAHNNLGVALSKKGLPDQAITAFREAIRLKPNYGIAHFNLGVRLYNKGELDEAIASYRRALSIQPKDYRARNYLGFALGKKGLVDEAVRECSLAVRLKPDDAECHNNLGAILCDYKKDYDGAIAAFRRAIELAPEHAAIRHNLGHALIEKGSFDEGIEACRQAITRKPGNAATLHDLGFALVQKGAVDEGIGVLQKAIQARPNHASTHNELGVAFSAKGKVDDAITEYKESIHLDANNFKPHMNLCVAFMTKSAWNDAIAAAKEAIRCKPDLANAHCNLGHALREKGQLKDALQSLRRGHELGSKDPRWPYPSAKWVAECQKLIEKSEPGRVAALPDKAPTPAATLTKTPPQKKNNPDKPVPSKSWVIGFGGPGVDSVSRMTRDAAGNIYVIGSFSKTIKFGATQLETAGGSGFLAKLDSAGRVLWAIAPGGRSNAASAIAIDPAGNLYVAGHFHRDIKLGAESYTSAGGVDSFLAKFRGSDGHCLWAQRFGEAGHDWLVNLAVDAQGSVFVAGGFDNRGDVRIFKKTRMEYGGREVVVKKFNSEGAPLWTTKVTGTMTIASLRALVVDSAGDVYAAGAFDGKAEFPVGTLSSESSYREMFVAKFDGQKGRSLWARQFAGTTDGQVYGAAVAPGGILYLVGAFEGTVRFASDGLTSVGAADGFVARLNTATGAVDWGRHFGGDNLAIAYGVGVDSQGNVHAVGSIRGKAKFGAETLTVVGDENAFVTTLSQSGEFLKSMRFAEKSITANARCINIDKEGNRYIGGGFSGGEADFPPGTLKAPNAYPDGYLMKLANN